MRDVGKVPLVSRHKLQLLNCIIWTFIGVRQVLSPYRAFIKRTPSSVLELKSGGQHPRCGFRIDAFFFLPVRLQRHMHGFWCSSSSPICILDLNSLSLPHSAPNPDPHPQGPLLSQRHKSISYSLDILYPCLKQFQSAFIALHSH